jgi:DNA polymerase III epsilon subunit-like protein
MVDTGLIVLDIETTGLCCRPCNRSGPQDDNGSYDEILQLAIIDGAGKPLFYDSFKPVNRRSWTATQRIHGVAPRDVKEKAPFSERKAEIQSIIDVSRLLIAYNAEFDLGFLSAQGIGLEGKRFICLMKEFARIYGRKKVHGKGYTWQSLETCARYYGIVNLRAHDALADARVTLRCYRAFVQEGRHRARNEKWGVC